MKQLSSSSFIIQIYSITVTFLRSNEIDTDTRKIIPLINCCNTESNPHKIIPFDKIAIIRLPSSTLRNLAPAPPEIGIPHSNNASSTSNSNPAPVLAEADAALTR